MARVRAPELPQNSVWLNTDCPLSLKSLKGRIVLLDFWTYGCINCLHVLPDLKYLEQKYQDNLTVIGVHSAKFDHEKDTENIRQAALRYDIQHPILVDRDFEVWQQYAVRAYPTFAVIDPKGYIVGFVSGEGKRKFLDELIEKIIHEHQNQGVINLRDLVLEQPRSDTPLRFPSSVLADEERDRLFIADTRHHRIVVTTLNGKVLEIIGAGQPGWIDGKFSEAQFFAPQGMTLNRANQILYIADTENHLVRRVDLNQKTVSTIAGTGEQSHTIYPHGGKALEISLNSPWDLELLKNCLFVAMAGSHQIWKMELENDTIATYIGTGAEGCVDGQTTQAAFAQPSGIAIDQKNLFVADSETSSIRAISLGETPEVFTVCGSGFLYGFGDVDGISEAVRLQHCLGIEFANSLLWIADTYNHKIKTVTLDGICTTILGNGKAGHQDREGLNSQFFEPSGLSATSTHLYIADTNNHVIRRVDLKTFSVMTLKFPDLCAPDVCFPTFTKT